MAVIQVLHVNSWLQLHADHLERRVGYSGDDEFNE